MIGLCARRVSSRVWADLCWLLWLQQSRTGALGMKDPGSEEEAMHRICSLHTIVCGCHTSHAEKMHDDFRRSGAARGAERGPGQRGGGEAQGGHVPGPGQPVRGILLLESWHGSGVSMPRPSIVLVAGRQGGLTLCLIHQSDP